ncbi:protein EARLY RESPONSIVE TO DEHYDRATION 15-like [Punica granatum]|uniref:Uncharacterized protein n=2 Tax=Punica granatum TaxID=22663 RepID=A0A218WB81_PUNGR|nr:protein EARLY RESPONSIVE TO DEHYDRATION 15-like [Punica granatum]OWM69906.1 hypothetical protein CDL15_Pgr025755 [Punica granatum]PKI62203.1 hypothetical protein CRG98_017401 [Punica granatum]
MGVITGTYPAPPPASSLNPNAPPFVPAAYRAVEDFSEQWWALVQSSPWFRDYWLQERYSDPQLDDFGSDFDDFLLLPEDLDVFDDYDSPNQEDGKKDDCTDLVPIGGFKWRKPKAERPRFAEKAPKIVSAKVSPRMIQQPR